MKTVNMDPAGFLFPENQNCFQIPPFQRKYVWSTDRAHRLVQDVNKATFETKLHWVGIVLVAKSERPCGRSNNLGHNCWDILDGQQRMITLRLWLIALADEYRRQQGSDLPGLSRSLLTEVRVHTLDQKNWSVISNPDRLVNKERDSFARESNNNSVLRNYWYFRWILLNGLSAFESDEALKVPKRRGRKDDPLIDHSVVDYWLGREANLNPINSEDLVELAKKTVNRLNLTALQHESEDESPEEIFETLNAERTELGQFDLARNFIFISLQTGSEQQRKFYDEYFFKAEEALSNAPLDLRTEPLDVFLYEFLISSGIFGKELGRSSTATCLKLRWSDLNSTGSVNDFLTMRLTPAMYAWLAIRSGSDKVIGAEDTQLSSSISRKLKRIESFSKGPFVPVSMRSMLQFLGDGSASALDRLDKELHLIEIFLARSLLAGEPFSKMRSLGMSLCKALQEEETSLDEWVSRNSPSDQRIRYVALQSCANEGHESDPAKWPLSDDLGARCEPNQLRALFDGLSEQLEGEHGKVLVARPNQRNRKNSKSAFWLEHYFPQKSARWASDLKEWGVELEKMEVRLNALGNISILTDFGNQTMSNKPLAAKQAEYRTSKVATFKINHEFSIATKWTPEEIDTRTRSLTDEALKFWALPLN